MSEAALTSSRSFTLDDLKRLTDSDMLRVNQVITDNLASGKVFADLGLPPMDAGHDRAMVCGSLAFNLDVKAVLEGFGLNEGANSEPREYVVEKAFVGDGI